MEPTTQKHTLNLTGVLTTSKQIILKNYTHFITLSLLFLPLVFSFIIPQKAIPSHPLNDQKLMISYLIHTLIIHIFTLCAIGSITFKTHHAFNNSSVTMLDSLTSLTVSFFPLASTAIAAYILTLFISTAFLMLVGIILMLVQYSQWFVIDYNSIHFLWFLAIVGLLLIAIIVYVHVEWSLAYVVVVVESKWGFAPLMRSSYLVKGMRLISLWVMLYFGVAGAGIVWICVGSFDVSNIGPFVVLLGMLGSFFLMMMLLRITAANTVLYNYCKALHGELVIEVADQGFDHYYVDLASDDTKVPSIVTVVAA